MAKGFPYFKFTATEWLTGDIVFEDYELQGIFINICALYWHRDGNLTLEDISKRLKTNRVTELKNRFIDINEGNITIKFLDEQLMAANHISKVNSDNGSNGGRPLRVVKDGSAIFYVLKCSLDGEVFYKAGITTEGISRRFSNTTGGNKKMPYNFEIVISKELPTLVALSLEKMVSDNFEQYAPKTKFSGHKECYLISDNFIQYIENEIAITENKRSKTEVKPKKSKEEKEEEVNKNNTYTDFVARFNEIRKTNFKGDKKSKGALIARLKDGNTVEDILAATKEAMTEQHHIDSEFKYITPEFMTRADKLERYLQQARSKSQPSEDTKPDMTGWTEAEIYRWKFHNDKVFRNNYNSANESQPNTTELEKRTTLKEFYNQETLRFKYTG